MIAKIHNKIISTILFSIVIFFFAVNGVFGAIDFTYTESTNRVVNTGGTAGAGASDCADFVHFDRTVATTACTIASGAELKAATAVANPTDLTLTYPMRPVEFKGLRLAITTAANGGAAVSGDETVDIYGTTCVWQKLTGASASGQAVVPIADLTHNYQVGDTVILIDISAPATYETDTIASIQEGVSITMTNNNTNSYAIGDIVGIYQTEQIDVSAAFNTYWSTVPYGQSAKFTFTGFDGTNTAKVDQPIWGVIWDYGNGQYKIDAHVEFGDDNTSTYFASYYEQVYFADGCKWYVKDAAVLELGKLYASWGSKGSTWSFEPGSAYTAMSAGTMQIYASVLHSRSNHATTFAGGTLTILNSTLSNEFEGNAAQYNRYFKFSGGTITFNRVFFCNVASLNLSTSPTMTNVHIHRGKENLVSTSSVTGSNVLITGSSVADVWVGYNNNATIIDSEGAIGTVVCSSAAAWIKEQYTCNIHVADKDGGAIANTATVACTRANVVTESAKFYKCITAHTSGTFATDLAAGKWEEITDATILAAAPAWLTSTAYVSAEQEFSVNPTSGAIAEQNLTYKKWTGTSELETKYLHTFTLSEAGYKTLVINDKEIKVPVVWHEELQSITMPPAPFFGDLKADDYYYAEAVNE